MWLGWQLSPVRDVFGLRARLMRQPAVRLEIHPSVRMGLRGILNALQQHLQIERRSPVIRAGPAPGPAATVCGRSTTPQLAGNLNGEQAGPQASACEWRM